MGFQVNFMFESNDLFEQPSVRIIKKQANIRMNFGVKNILLTEIDIFLILEIIKSFK